MARTRVLQETRRMADTPTAEHEHCARNAAARRASCGIVDESYGPARALRAVWTARGQR